MKFFLNMALVFSVCQNVVADTLTSDAFEYGDCAFACKSIPPDSEVPRFFGIETASELKSNRLNVLVWNIYKGRKKEFIPAFQALSKGRDLVLISEGTTAAPVTSAFELLPDFGWNFSVSFLMKNEVGTGTAIGSYAKAYDVKHYRTKDLEPAVKSPKAMTSAKFSIDGFSEKILVISIHGINWSGDEAIVRQVADVMPEIQAHQGPIVFAGDFNFKNKTRLQEVAKLLATAGLQRVTWVNPLKKQLDDAFTRGVVVHSAKLNHDFDDTGSDHPAIELELEVPNTFEGDAYVIRSLHLKEQP